MSVALALVSYNQGSEIIQDYLSGVIVLSEEESEQRFWALIGNQPDFYMNSQPEDREAVFGLTTPRYIYVSLPPRLSENPRNVSAST